MPVAETVVRPESVVCCVDHPIVNVILRVWETSMSRVEAMIVELVVQ